MTAKSLLTRGDARRLAEVAKSHGCVISVSCGDKTVTIKPAGIDEAEDGPMTLAEWRNRRRELPKAPKAYARRSG